MQYLNNIFFSFQVWICFIPGQCGCSKDSRSVETILSYIDDVTQWSESQEPKEPNDEVELPDEVF